MFHWINRFCSSESLSGSLIMGKISTLGTSACATLPNSVKQTKSKDEEEDSQARRLADSKLRKLLLENEENELLAKEEQGEKNESKRESDESLTNGDVNNPEIQKDTGGLENTEKNSEESKENLESNGDGEKKVEESPDIQEKSNEQEIKENDTENSKEDEDFNLDNEIEDDSDDDKLHIVENEEENIQQPLNPSQHPNTDQCPFDCCALGLNHTLAKMNDKENHDAFKKAHEIKYSVLLRAGRPELLESIEFDDFWRNFQSEEDLNEEIHSTENGEFNSIEQASAAEKSILQMENVSPIVHGIVAGENYTKKCWKESSAREKSGYSREMQQEHLINLAAAAHKSEEGRLKMKRTSSFTDTSSQQLPPKKRDRIYRPWTDLSCQTGALRVGDVDMNYPAGVIDLSKSQRNSAEEDNARERVERNHKATFLEKYDHITALENGNLVYMCKTCFTTLKSEDEIKAHRYCQGVTKSMHCYLCRQDFTMENYREHLEHHDAHPAALKCKQCGLVFDNFTQKSIHQKTVHRTDQRDKDATNANVGNKDVPYICYLCGQDFNFNSKAALSHTLTHVNGYPFPCDFCNNWFKGIETAVTRFVLRRNGFKSFLCGVDPNLYMGLFSNNTN